MYVFNVPKAISYIEKEESLDTNSFSLKEGIDREEFVKFLRIMEAKTPDEISDIRTEDILKMFEQITTYMPYFTEWSYKEHAYASKLSNVPGINLTRRVL